MDSRELLQQTIGLTLVVLLLGGCGGAQAGPTATARSLPEKDTDVAPQLDYDSGCARPILYPCGPQLCAVCPDGSGPIQLTTKDAANHSPAWSPDGRWIAFISSRDGDGEIFIMRPDASGQTQLTFDEAEVLWFSWSPDGQWIAFSSAQGEADFEIFVVRPDGTGLRRLADGMAPAWSPDGQWIVFASKGDEASGIFIMRPDGSEQTQLTFFKGGGGALPSWSPDGRWIAFIGPDSEDYWGWDMYVMRSDGSDQTQLTHDQNPELYRSPSWSPDSQWIAFGSVREEATEEGSQIFVVRPDGTSLRRLSDGMAPAWSPDGQWIAFVSLRDGDHEIFITRPDGSEQTQLTFNTTVDYFPDW